LFNGNGNFNFNGNGNFKVNIIINSLKETTMKRSIITMALATGMLLSASAQHDVMVQDI